MRLCLLHFVVAFCLLFSGIIDAVADVATPAVNNWSINFAVVAITVVMVAACVILHYEVLNFLSRRLAHLHGSRRHRVLVGIFGVLTIHIVEIWIFGITIYLLLLSPAFGSIHGITQPAFLDHIYLSAITYTTVGFGDVYPSGAIRFLVGTEALTGFVLITWSASFTFLEMESFWRSK